MVKTKRRLYFKNFSKTKSCLYIKLNSTKKIFSDRIKSKYSRLKFDNKLRMQLFKENLRELRHIKCTQDTATNLAQLGVNSAINVIPIVLETQQDRGLEQLHVLLNTYGGAQVPQDQDYVFLLSEIDKLPIIDLSSDKLTNANREEIFEFLLENNGIKPLNEKETFNQLFDIAAACQKGKITNVEHLNEQLQGVLKVSGGELRDYSGLIILLLAILLKTCDIESFGPHGQIPQLPHIEAAKDFFKKCLKPENRGSTACTPRFQTSLEAKSNDNSEDSNFNAIQASQFTENGRLSIDKAYLEVLRRADKLKCSGFYTQGDSYHKFSQLVIEDKKPTQQGIREAITGLQGEMEGHYSDLSRLDIGRKGKNNSKILGPDFEATNENGNKVVVEVKNLVYNKELKPTETAFENGKQMGAKAYRQQHYWNQTNEDALRKRFGSNIKIENLPQESKDFVLVFDLFDVDQDARNDVIAGIKEGAKNSDQIVIINPIKNC